MGLAYILASVLQYYFADELGVKVVHLMKDAPIHHHKDKNWSTRCYGLARDASQVACSECEGETWLEHEDIWKNRAKGIQKMVKSVMLIHGAPKWYRD